MWVQRIVRRWRNGSKRNRISYRGIVGGILPAILLVIFLLSAISDSSENRCREENEKNDTKGYDLPVDEREREEAWDDCIRMMQQYLPGGNGSGMSYSKEDMRKMQKKAARAGFPVTTSIPYSNMENYESAEQFLVDCMDGTMTLTVDAVCDMVVCEDAMISSELTVRFSEDGSFRYLGNRVR